MLQISSVGSENPTLSLVIPIFNEEEVFPILEERILSLLKKLPSQTEVILIDDGSSDKSAELIVELCRRDLRFKFLQLSRNFGHQVAITAGMDFAEGDAVVIMDADLQDPPELILQMIQKWQEGYEVVYAIRKEREGESAFKKTTAKLFYRFLQKLSDVEIPQDVGDFRLVDRKALNAFKQLRERSRFVRGMFSWIGFKQTGVYFERSARAAGETKYPLKKMLKLAFDGIIGFSTLPLRFALNLGLLVAGASFVFGCTAIFLKLGGFYTVSGWTSIIVVLCFMGGVQLAMLGVLGEYLGRIHEEVKHRPLYLVSRLENFKTEVGIEQSVKKFS